MLVDAAAPAALGRAATDALRTSVRQGPVAAWLVERALARRTPFLAAAPALLALAPRCGDARIGAVVQEWLAHPLDPARRAACDALADLALAEPARVERTGALDALAGRVEDADPEVALSAVVAIGRIGPAGAALEAVLELAEERRGGLRAAAVAALAHARDPRALEAAREALEAKAAPVQLAAIATLRALGGRPAVDALVEALRDARGGRPEAELLATLRALTHANPGDEAAAWRKWWRAVREDYDFGSLPASAPRRGDEGGATRTRGVPTYYGAEVVSRRVTFVVDVSGSMSADVKGAGADRLELCKRELLGVIAALPKRACFNLIPFNGAFEPWQPRLVPASAAARAAARAFVEGLQAGGGTNIYDPLEAALLDPQVDTIYLLTDGAPSAGKFVVPAEILREVRRLNAARQVAIHTISVGGRSPLLRQLAEENGGRYAAR